MKGSLARWIDQAEVGLSEITRRTVQSVTVPIRAKGQELATETIDTVLGIVKTVAIKAVLGLVAAIMVVVAIVYAVAALYQYLLPLLGPVEARLVLAGLFLLIAVIAVVLLILWPRSTPTPKTIVARADKASAAAANGAASVANDARTATRKAEAVSGHRAEAAAARTGGANAVPPPPVDLASGFDTMVSALGDAGFRREQAGLKAGLALASQLKPMQIVSLALIGGFIAATRSSRRSWD